MEDSSRAIPELIFYSNLDSANHRQISKLEQLSIHVPELREMKQVIEILSLLITGLKGTFKKIITYLTSIEGNFWREPQCEPRPVSIPDIQERMPTSLRRAMNRS